MSGFDLIQSTHYGELTEQWMGMEDEIHDFSMQSKSMARIFFLSKKFSLSDFLIGLRLEFIKSHR